MGKKLLCFSTHQSASVTKVKVDWWIWKTWAARVAFWRMKWSTPGSCWIWWNYFRVTQWLQIDKVSRRKIWIVLCQVLYTNRCSWIWMCGGCSFTSKENFWQMMLALAKWTHATKIYFGKISVPCFHFKNYRIPWWVIWYFVKFPSLIGRMQVCQILSIA